MTPKTLRALYGSIKKWQGIVDGTVEDRGAENCPLCHLFHFLHRSDNKPDCAGCPVAARTGRDGCRETPYDDFRQAEPGSRAERKAARAELAFLISLLPG